MLKLNNGKYKHYINYIAIAIVALVFGGISLGGSLPFSTINLLEKIAISIILATSLSMVVGFLGELSLGHAGFMCLGAYIGGKVSCLLQPVFGNSIVSLLISILVGGAVAAVFGIVIGLPALRLKGDYLAIVTLAFGEIVRTVFMNSSDESFGGSLGLATPRFDKKYLFIIAFVFVIICLAVIQNFIRSKHGRAITSIRDNEIAAKATGINIVKYKLTVFTISSLFAGIAGVLYSYSNYRVQSSNFDYNYSIEILVMVVLGGMGSINGSIIAATLITYLDTTLQTVLTGNLAVLQDLFYALILIILVIYNNAPALSTFRTTHNLKTFFNRFTKHDPSKRRDDEAKWDRVPTKIEMNEILSVDLQPTSSTLNPDKKEGK